MADRRGNPRRHVTAVETAATDITARLSGLAELVMDFEHHTVAELAVALIGAH
jgi:hypothetical protein